MRKNSEVAESIRQTAYFLWEHDGRPEGQASTYWLRAKEIHIRRMAYDRWLADGAPEGESDGYWNAASGDIE